MVTLVLPCVNWRLRPLFPVQLIEINTSGDEVVNWIQSCLSPAGDERSLEKIKDLVPVEDKVTLAAGAWAES